MFLGGRNEQKSLKPAAQAIYHLGALAFYFRQGDKTDPISRKS